MTATSVRVCVCMCVRERMKEREREGGDGGRENYSLNRAHKSYQGNERERDYSCMRARVYVCVSVCERGWRREGERELLFKTQSTAQVVSGQR